MTAVEIHIHDKIESWINDQCWDSEVNVSDIMAETNSIFDELTYGEITLTEIDNSIFSFAVCITLIGEPRKDDVMFCGDTINIDVNGFVIFESSSGKWDIQEDFEVNAALDDYGPYDVVFSENSAPKPSIAEDLIVKLSSMKRGLWYRGHSDINWQLQTSIARKKPSISAEESLRNEFERRIAFLDTIKHPLPLPDIYFLMQHHGIPTRLLDWTSNPLVALYFAISDESQLANDACIWVMDPGQLNRSFGENYPLKMEEGMLTGLDQEKIIAICAHHTNNRMNSQRSEFTVHMNYTPMEQILKASPALKESIIVPSRLKQELKDRLKILGIDRSTLFPDLDNIAKTVVEDVLGN